MCGIAGFFGQSNIGTHELLLRLSDAQQHRGPDGSATWMSQDHRAGLAHRRLAIVDLTETGNQPMHSNSGRYTISFNGEIYNFLELRSELLGDGHKFRGGSDTEVMLAAVEQWGVRDAIAKFNGMFAFALWDKMDNKGYLVRDRLGVKPLYYQWCGTALFFSSELTVPFARIAPRSISRESLALFLHYGHVPGERSIYEGIYKLKPGMIAVVSTASAPKQAFEAIIPYWETTKRINEILASRNDDMSEAEAVERLNSALSRSVRQRMISDVPLGAFLSGGIDSSLIVAHMQQASSRPVRTFTIGFHDEKADEAPYAKKIAQHLGTEHTELYITEQDALNVIPSLPTMYGEPFADSSQIPTFLVSKLTRSHVTVALSGDGGDELFAGYNNYRSVLKYQNLLRVAPGFALGAAAKVLGNRSMRRILRSALAERHLVRMANAATFFSEGKRDRAPHSRFFDGEVLVIGDGHADSPADETTGCAGNAIEQLMCRDLNAYLPDDILVKVDRASMAVSLEVRAPFVDDYELFETAWQIPFTHKLSQTHSKIMLKKALQRFVPMSLFERPKQGFSIPLIRWLVGPLKEWVEDCISVGRLRTDGYLHEKEVHSIYRKVLSGDDFYADRLWTICMFQSWLSTNSLAAVACS